jgi:hypothetical protein
VIIFAAMRKSGRKRLQILLQWLYKAGRETRINLHSGHFHAFPCDRSQSFGQPDAGNRCAIAGTGN